MNECLISVPTQAQVLRCYTQNGVKPYDRNTNKSDGLVFDISIYFIAHRNHFVLCVYLPFKHDYFVSKSASGFVFLFILTIARGENMEIDSGAQSRLASIIAKCHHNQSAK